MGLLPGREPFILDPSKTTIMKTVSLLACWFAFAAVGAQAQTASLTTDNPYLARSGGVIALTATVAYEGEPGAIGWSIQLPADWSLVSVSGSDVPQVSPEAGSTGTLEFAYTQLPAGKAGFTVVVRYPENAASTAAKTTVIVRSGGKLTTLDLGDLAFFGGETNNPQDTRP